MGTITLGLIDIGSAILGYLGAKIIPKVVAGATPDGHHDKSALQACVERIEGNLAKIKAAM